MMATIDIAVQAEAMLVLPPAVVAEFVERSRPDSILIKGFHALPTLAQGRIVKYTRLDGREFFDDDATVEACDLSYDGDAGGPMKSSPIKWISKRASLAGKSFDLLDSTLEELDAHLTLRTYVAGFRLAAVDLAHGNILRWYTYVEYSVPWVSDVAASVTAASVAERTKGRAEASTRGASYDIDLPTLQGPVVTRFPPEPSGYLHIGHAKAALLNEYFAHQTPGGTLICRFDDTNPSNESLEFQDAIIDDLGLLGIVPDKTTFSSDHFHLMYGYALQLIRDGRAFADHSELGKGDEARRRRLPSKRRNLSIDETLARFDDMKTGSAEGQRWCLRAKIAHDSANGAMRDPVIYRCNPTPHHRTGTSWRMYPTCDFCAPILDAVEGFQQALRLRKVNVRDFSRVNFARTLLSKRKSARIVDEAKVWGWDDPRMPTIRGIVRRGMTAHALQEYMLKQGPSRNTVNLEWGAEKSDILEEWLTAETEFRDQAFADGNVVDLNVGTVAQLERKGYYIYDGRHGSRMVFFNVPTSRM
ncbi:glutamyl-trna synthetase [Drechmeria coniospora]|uniref:Glutamyl-trna synthetase n=1 Tax=Drechmeria coniospora TaxID=98403 RepID=A0A151GNV0_DRECN|nr:glutamyl-trna synthetase [Drechmeria coniospora]KYK58797.1 glutamyl-trna synthetase [Drechmeria coniospora]